MAAVGALDEGRAPGAGIVAGPAALDLNHVGAEIGQNLAGPRPGQNPGKLEDTQSGQWTRLEMNSRQRRGFVQAGGARRRLRPLFRLPCSVKNDGGFPGRQLVMTGAEH